ncbi:MAG TPA: LAGLIDADG family homing endonuclease [Mucilaginibacter sp.]|jgi:hypothetical protein|nr:LAGLIDADG family homing endonuclease [Mucilaginibacter sp.]
MLKSSKKRTKRVLPYTPEFLAYVAGFFDGEGCVYVTKSGEEYLLRTHVTNTCREVLQVFKEQFGGYISTSINKKNPHHKIVYMWTLDYNHALDFLRLIEPWVGVKNNQLFLARIFGVIKNKDRSITRSPEYHEVMVLIKDQMQWLNRKGKRLDADIEPMKKIFDLIPQEDFQNIKQEASRILILAGYNTCH